MNKNIEVINKHIYAVKFSLIPLIPDIGSTNLDIDERLEFARYTSDYRVILNKDYPAYPIVLKRMKKIVQMKDHELDFSINYLRTANQNDPIRTLYRILIEFEIERRNRMKGR